ncbi:EscU/YscU/HrcU family type III secretion system export apparatus switch protein [Miltoncostaea marina]|uniref:EscU/YscU/HrcU family type III secretion system export apparatus switch protein n=1 Tax=Miltoncostaea marina TaxID=2843215 RepID=UPI001FE792C3|nr:EscU/YscU/HrcU family type III secretion system export apparatus switch protein [Miltoncostaea marina]
MSGRRRRAVALRYRGDEAAAPRVTAAGAGPVADRIVEAAREHGVPLREDPDLAATLAALDLGALVPPELYEVIAEVLAWAYRANAGFAARPGAGADPAR